MSIPASRTPLPLANRPPQGLEDVEGPPILSIGFRPFFFGASAFAALWMPLWLLVLAGVVKVEGPSPFAWHAHEMLHGYTMAVIAGFLLTAVANWTGQRTATGGWLFGLLLLWLLGRLAWLVPLPTNLALALDLAFIPALAVSIGRPLFSSRRKRNFPFLGILALMWSCNWAADLGERYGMPVPFPPHRVMLDLIVLLIGLIGGRVFPMFTRNATGVQTIRNQPILDVAAIASLVALLFGDLTGLDDSSRRVIVGLAALVNAARMITWGSRHAKAPLLWVLHVGYAWVPLGLGLRAFELDWTGKGATHALTVGAIGTLTLGMMARVSLGHSGRHLVAPKKTNLAFVLMTLAALVRTFGSFQPIMRPAWMVAGVLWTLSFALFLIDYVPIWFSPRVDSTRTPDNKVPSPS